MLTVLKRLADPVGGVVCNVLGDITTALAVVITSSRSPRTYSDSSEALP